MRLFISQIKETSNHNLTNKRRGTNEAVGMGEISKCGSDDGNFVDATARSGYGGGEQRGF
jgi:hypothetical protein